MSQRNQLLRLFEQYGYRLTLAQILQTTLAAEYRARMSEMRKEGMVINCIKGKTPSENVYQLVYWDKTGQGALL